MHIDERIEQAPAGVLPKLYYVLDSAISVESRHEALDLRHPLSIYTVSLSTIREKINKAVSLIGPMYSDPERFNGKDDPDLRDATDAMLDALMEHLDDCRNIINCYILDEADKAGKNAFDVYGGNIRAYRDHVGKIVNFIKHKQRRIRTIAFYGNGWSTPGYFVEGPAGKEMLGPDPQIHLGGGTAFSFSRDLRYHLCGVYYVSSSAVTTLRQLNTQFRREAVMPERPADHEDKWLEMLTKVSSLNRAVFPDEASKKYPEITVNNGAVRLSFPSKEKPKPVPSVARISTSFEVDKISRSYRLPYFIASDHA